MEITPISLHGDSCNQTRCKIRIASMTPAAIESESQGDYVTDGL